MDFETIKNLNEQYNLLYYVHGNRNKFVTYLDVENLIKNLDPESQLMIFPDYHIIFTDPELFDRYECISDDGKKYICNFLRDSMAIKWDDRKDYEKERYRKLSYFYGTFRVIDSPIYNQIRFNLIGNIPKISNIFPELKVDDELTIDNMSSYFFIFKYGRLVINWRSYTYMEYLMRNHDDWITKILEKWGISNLQNDEATDLLFLLSHYKYQIIQPREIINFLCNLTVDELIALARWDKYHMKPYPWARIYLLYYFLTGYFSEKYLEMKKNPDFYNQIKELYPFELLENFSDHKYEWEIPPYQTGFNILNEIKRIDIDELIEKYQVVFPPRITNPSERYKYIKLNIKEEYYDNINEGDMNFLPDNFEDWDADNTFDLLENYTDRQLVTKYPEVLKYDWEDRRGLEYLIFAIYRGPHWTKYKKNNHIKCRNDDTNNLIDDIPHGKINKIKNRTYAYGPYDNQNCYQEDELEASFFEDSEGQFHFYVPDGTIIKEFPAKSMYQLFDLTGNEQLKDKIKYGLSKINIVDQEIYNYINIYNSFNDSDKRVFDRSSQDTEREGQVYSDKQWATIYLVWLFLFSMWVRFWKGPGNPYPHKNHSVEYCVPANRDNNVILQLNVRNAILENVPKEVKEWIEILPLIKFDWKNRDVVEVKNKGSLELTINQIADGKYCEGIAGDNLSATAYMLLIKFFGLTDINPFVNQWMSQVFNIEKQTIEKQLSELEKWEDKTLYNVYNERLKELNKDIIQQPEFDPNQMEYTQHIN